MWNENHGEIHEKVWVNQKTKKKKSKTSMINSYLIGVTCKIFFVAENTTPRETKNKEKDLKRERIGGGGRRWEEEKRISC